MDSSMNSAINSLSNAYRNFGEIIMNSMADAKKQFTRAYRFSSRSGKRWTMMAKNGQNTKERKRNQVKLKGRGCRDHKGGYPTRGKGRTSRSKR